MLIFISEPTLIIHWMWAFLRPQMLKLMKISALIWRYFDRCSGRSLSDASTHFPLCGCRLAWFLSIKNISYPIFTKQKWHPTAGRKLFSKWRIWLCMNSCSTKSLSTRLNISSWCFTFRHSSNVYCHSWLCFRLLLTDMLLVFFWSINVRWCSEPMILTRVLHTSLATGGAEQQHEAGTFNFKWL